MLEPWPSFFRSAACAAKVTLLIATGLAVSGPAVSEPAIATARPERLPAKKIAEDGRVAWASAEALAGGIPPDWRLVGEEPAVLAENRSRLRRGLDPLCSETQDPLNLLHFHGRQSFVKLLAERRNTIFLGRILSRRPGWFFQGGIVEGTTKDLMEIKVEALVSQAANDLPTLSPGMVVQSLVPQGGKVAVGDSALCAKRPPAIEFAEVGDQVITIGWHYEDSGEWESAALLVVKDGKIGPLDHPHLRPETWDVATLGPAIRNWMPEMELPAGAAERILWWDPERTLMHWVPADLLGSLPFESLSLDFARGLDLAMNYARHGTDMNTRHKADCFSQEHRSPPPKLIDLLPGLASDDVPVLIGRIERGEIGWSSRSNMSTRYVIAIEEQLSGTTPLDGSLSVLSSQAGGEFFLNGIKVCMDSNNHRALPKVGDRVLMAVVSRLTSPITSFEEIFVMPLVGDQIQESPSQTHYLTLDDVREFFQGGKSHDQ